MESTKNNETALKREAFRAELLFRKLADGYRFFDIHSGAYVSASLTLEEAASWLDRYTTEEEQE